MKKNDNQNEINDRILNIISNLKKRQPSQQDLLDMVEQVPPFPTFPDKAGVDRSKKYKKSIYIK